MEHGARSKEQGAWSKEHGAWSMEQEASQEQCDWSREAGERGAWRLPEAFKSYLCGFCKLWI
jgi:hypothetical protein